MAQKDKEQDTPFSLAIHGGAGRFSRAQDVVEVNVFNSMTEVLEAGRDILARGGMAVDAVEACVRMLEDDPLYNAGYGAIHNRDGVFELDAAIMDGSTLDVGAVMAVRSIRNPVSLARKVMDDTPHVMLAGEGALAFAKETGEKIERITYFRKGRDAIPRPEPESENPADDEHGTVGAVARDIYGNLAAATSTGGWTTKMPGRVGDTPIIGGGTFADNASCAVSCTGKGEDFIRTVIAHRMAALIELRRLDTTDAATVALGDLVEKAQGYGGFISIGKDGAVAVTQSSDYIRHGWIEHGGETVVGLQAPIRRLIRNE